MAGIQYRDPVRAISGAAVYPGASLSVFESDGVTLAAIYADVEQETRLGNPMTADSAGRFPLIYADLGVELIVRLVDADDTEVFEEAITPDIVPIAVYDTTPRDDTGELMPGAARTFYAEDTSELAAVWADNALTVALDNPVEADGGGAFADVYLDSDLRYRAVLHEAPGNPEVKPDAGYYAGKRYIGGRLIYDAAVRMLPNAEPPVDLRFTPGLAGDFYGIRTYAPAAGTILEDSGFLSARFASYAHIITYHFVEFRARTAPFSQDAFASIELVELGVTLYTASAGAFYQTGSTMIWQWFPASVTVDYNPAQTYSLRFT